MTTEEIELTPEERETLRQATPPAAVVTEFLADYKTAKSRNAAALAAAMGLTEGKTDETEEA